MKFGKKIAVLILLSAVWENGLFAMQPRALFVDGAAGSSIQTQARDQAESSAQENDSYAQEQFVEAPDQGLDEQFASRFNTLSQEKLQEVRDNQQRAVRFFDCSLQSLAKNFTAATTFAIIGGFFAKNLVSDWRWISSAEKVVHGACIVATAFTAQQLGKKVLTEADSFRSVFSNMSFGVLYNAALAEKQNESIAGLSGALDRREDSLGKLKQDFRAVQDELCAVQDVLRAKERECRAKAEECEQLAVQLETALEQQNSVADLGTYQEFLQGAANQIAQGVDQNRLQSEDGGSANKSYEISLN